MAGNMSRHSRYECWMIFDGFPSPKPTVSCAGCGETLPDDDTPFYQCRDTGLLYCKRRCTRHGPFAEKQADQFALINLASLGFVE